VVATNAGQQYVGSSYSSYGVADLYTYGSWYPVNGFGACWRPYGVGLGWSPFASGGWFTDPIYGTSFIGSQPWGWLPYHFGGWIFDPFLGWLWNPAFGGLGYGYVPVTGVFVRSKPGLLGIVPVHPLDVHGKTPLNLAKGVFPVTGGALGASVPVAAGEQWKVVKTVPANTLRTNFVASTTPVRTSRTVIAGNLGMRAITPGHGSSIAYDPLEHRFVNTNAAIPVSQMKTAEPLTGRLVSGVATQRTSSNPASSTSTRTTVFVPRTITPPPAPRAVESVRGGGSASGGGGGSLGGSRSSSVSSVSAPSHASAAPASSGGSRPH
jgi:hypothetical protein